MLNPDHLKIELLPEPKQTGMHVYMPRPHVRVTHMPTDSVVECKAFRSAHKNKSAALAAMEYLLIEIGVE